jgi:hypothetical protein
MSLPVSSNAHVIWDISVLVQSQAPIDRLVSLNHLIDVNMTENKHGALVTLSDQDRHLVPNRDFVLLIRDEMVQKPAGLVKLGPDGDQAVSISILPDFMSAKDRFNLL